MTSQLSHVDRNSQHIIPLVIYGYGDGDTHTHAHAHTHTRTHTHAHTRTHQKAIFKKPGAPGIKNVYFSHNNT